MDVLEQYKAAMRKIKDEGREYREKILEKARTIYSLCESSSIVDSRRPAGTPGSVDCGSVGSLDILRDRIRRVGSISSVPGMASEAGAGGGGSGEGEESKAGE